MQDFITEILEKNELILEEEKEIYKYGESVLIFNGLLLLIGILFSVFMGEFKFMFLFFLYFIPLRIFIGGYHCKTPIRCLFFTEGLFVLAILLYKYSNTIMDYYILNIILLFVACVRNVLLYNAQKKKSGYIGMLIFIGELIINFFIRSARIYIMYAFLISNIFFYFDFIKKMLYKN